MVAFRLPALRHIIGGASPYLRGSQRRWAQVHDVRFVATHRNTDGVLEKYREKLDRKAKEQGLKDVNELKAAYKEEIEYQKKAATITPPASPRSFTTSSPPSPSPSSPFPPPPPPPQGSSTSTPSTPPGIKTLSSYLDLPKTLTLPAPEISTLWRLRHASSPSSLCASIPSSTFTRLAATARAHPQFILPLPREGQGAEIHFLQWTFPAAETTTVLFTHLAEYKLRGEYANPHTTVTFHQELQESKGLVLMEGRVVDGRGISVEEGQWLVMCLQKFYGGLGGEGEARERRRLLERFSRGDSAFRVEELLEEAEKIV